MFDIAPTELLIVALVALVVIGPKDLPKAMKAVAHWVTKARKLSSEFHRGIDQIVREAELEEAREAIRSAGQMNLDRAVEQTIDPTGEVNRALQPPSEAEIDPETHIEKPEDLPILAAPEEPAPAPTPPIAPPAPKAEPA